MPRYLLLSILAATCVIPAGTVMAEPAETMILSVRLLEVPPTSREPRLLVEPAVSCVVGKPFSFISGGEIESNYVSDKIPIGTSLTGKVAASEKGKYPLTLALRLGKQLSAADTDTEVFREQTVRIGTHLTPGETKKIRCGNGQWCELRVEKGLPLDP